MQRPAPILSESIVSWMPPVVTHREEQALPPRAAALRCAGPRTDGMTDKTPFELMMQQAQEMAIAAEVRSEAAMRLNRYILLGIVAVCAVAVLRTH